MAGLVLQTLPNGRMLVFDVVDDSPADMSGIRMGDILVEVNSCDLREYKNIEIHEMFLQEGKSVTVMLVRESEMFGRTLNLRRLI
ncbi:PDZ domain-containing protein [bacterium]|nr:PDZ domain-containing protein [bacterium]